jgi:hydroxypyruvate isomerase
MRIKQSLCYPCFKAEDMSLDELCRTASDIGYQGIELWFRGEDFDELVAAARKHNLVIATMCGHTSLTEGLNNRADHDRIEAELRESIAIAAKLGIPGLICFSGNRIAGQSDEDAMEATAEGLRRVAALAESKGVNLNIELLNSKVDHPGYQCDHTAWGVAVCKKVGSPRVKLLYDIYHMQIMEGDVIRTLGENLEWFGHFHTAGNPGRHDLDDEQELAYAAICKAIARTDYDLYVAHEFTPKGDRIEALRRAFAICDQG